MTTDERVECVVLSREKADAIRHYLNRMSEHIEKYMDELCGAADATLSELAELTDALDGFSITEEDMK